MTDIFEYATRNKIRFSSPRGELSTEQLWDVPLRSKDDFNLNTVAKTVNKALRDATEDNFVETARSPSVAQVRLEKALAVVQHVIEVKLHDEALAKKRAENKLERDKILAILAEKQNGALSALSESQLKKRLDEIDSV